MPFATTLSTRAAAALAVLALLAGCKDEKPKPSPQAAAQAAAEAVRQAVEGDIRSTNAKPAGVQFRGVQVWRQAVSTRTAVCGLVNPLPDDPSIFVPFVSTVTAEKATDPPHYTFQHIIGTDTDAAARVYAALVTYCWDGGGPSDSPLQGITPMPPLPSSLPDPAHPPPEAAAPGTSQPATPSASGTVTLRQAANLHADPHGPVTRTVPKGSNLHVFGEANGWVQVGDTAPWGWVWGGMVDRN